MRRLSALIVVGILVLSQPLSAALITIVGFEAGSSAEINAVTGTTEWSTTTKRTGVYSFRTNPTTTAVGAGHFVSHVTSAFWLNSSWDKANIYAEFQFRVDDFPATNEPFFTCLTNASAMKMEVRVNSSGNILVYDSALGLVATGTTALSISTFYRIGIRCGTDSGPAADDGAYAVEINGSAELSGTANLTDTNSARAWLGKLNNRNGDTVDYFFDDVVIDDAAFVGNVEIKIGVPNADGSTQAWTNGSGGAGTGNWEEVEEVPIDAADYVTSTGVAGQVGLFAMQSAATVGVSGTIHAVTGMVRTVEDASNTSDTKMRFRSASTDSTGSGLDESATARTRIRLFATDPATSAAWTSSGVDGVEVGGVEENAVATRMLAVYMFVAYTPTGGGGSTNCKNLLVLGVGGGCD